MHVAGDPVVLKDLCKPDKELVFTTNHEMNLYSSYDIAGKDDNMTSCYCTLTPANQQDDSEQRPAPEPNIVIFEKTRDGRYNKWLNISGFERWGIDEHRDSLYLETTNGSDPYLQLPVIEQRLSLNNSAFIRFSKSQIYSTHLLISMVIRYFSSHTHGFTNKSQADAYC